MADEEGVTTVLDFPDEVITSILSYLGDDDAVFLCVAAACKRFHRLVWDEVAMRRRCLDRWPREAVAFDNNQGETWRCASFYPA